MDAVHLQIRNFKCELCSFTSATGYALKKHNQAVHEKIRNFKCDTCSFTAAQRFQLKDHKARVHDKIRNFKCDLCSFSSATGYALKKHKQTVHEKIRNFKCDLCSFTSAEKYGLRRHKEAVHEKVKDYRCETCSFYFASNSDLVRHKEATHENIVNNQSKHNDLNFTADGHGLISDIRTLPEETRNNHETSKYEHNIQAPSELGGAAVSSQNNIEEIKEEINEQQNTNEKPKHGWAGCEYCFEAEGQVARLTRDLADAEERIAAAEKRFDAERRLRLELERLVSQRHHHTQDFSEKRAKIKLEPMEPGSSA